MTRELKAGTLPIALAAWRVSESHDERIERCEVLRDLRAVLGALNLMTRELKAPYPRPPIKRLPSQNLMTRELKEEVIILQGERLLENLMTRELKAQQQSPLAQVAVGLNLMTRELKVLW